MILYSEHKAITAPVGFVCDVCGRRVVVENSYERAYHNTVEEQMGILRILPAGEEMHVCSMACISRVARRYRVRLAVELPALGQFDRSLRSAEAEREPEEERLAQLCRGLASVLLNVAENVESEKGDV